MVTIPFPLTVVHGSSVWAATVSVATSRKEITSVASRFIILCPSSVCEMEKTFPGVQIKRRSDAGLVRSLLGRETSPASLRSAHARPEQDESEFLIEFGLAVLWNT